MSSTDLSRFVRTDFLSLAERDLLQAPPGILLGVSGAAVEQLRALQIATVFDLALSRTFLSAYQLTTTPGTGSDFVRFGAAPADAVDADALAGKRIEQLQFEPISVLATIGPSNRPAIEDALGVKTVRELALWPPYQAARVILRRVLNVGEEAASDPEAPADLVPTTGRYPTERVIYHANFLIDVDAGGGALTDLGTAGLLALSGKPSLLMRPATGAILTFSQNWYPIGLSLGQLLYSMPLAPGESTKVAVIDWRRRTSTALTEEVSQTESLANTLTQNRAISEVVDSVARETQSGSSTIKSTADSSSVGASGGALVGGPALVGGTASASSTTSRTKGVFSSKGKREITASMQQQISDSTHQQAFSARNRHASTVSEAVAEERESISTRTVTNYNHMHALTVQYYEVVQMYRTELRLEQARRLLFVPFKPLDFKDEQVILRYRAALMAGADDPYVRDLLRQVTGVVSVSLDLPRFAPFVADEDDSKKEQLKAAKEAAKDRAIDTAKLKIAFARARKAGAVVRVTDQAVTSWEMPGEVSLINLGWDSQTNRVQQLRVTLESGSQLDVADNGFGRTDTSVNPDLGAAIPVNRLASIEVIFSEAAEPEEQRIDLRFMVGTRGVTLPCQVALPADRTERRLARFSPPVPMADVAEILSQDALYYSQIVWLNVDPNELVMLMGGLSYDGKRVIEFIDPAPVAVLGNAVGFVWGDEAGQAWKDWKMAHASAPPKHDLVPLPTDGVFAEAVLGRFNAAEKLDMSRFWNWQDSPIPIQAPEIAAIQAGQRQGVEPAAAGNLEGSLINIMAPRDLPAPAGVGPALNALTAGNMFRDMSGAAQLAAINQAALLAAASGATAAGTQAGANMATFGQFSVEAFKAALPLIGAAMGVPILPAPGSTNISNAGAVANEAGKIDAQVAATGGGASNVATGGSATGGSASGGTGGSGTGGAGGAGGTGTGGAGGSGTGTGGGGGSARSTGGGGAQPNNRTDVVRAVAGLPPEPEVPLVRDVVFNFVFRDPQGNPIDGRFDLILRKDGMAIDGQTVTRQNPFVRQNVEFVLGHHFEEVLLGDVPGPLFIQIEGEPLLGTALSDPLRGISNPIQLPRTFTTYTFNVDMGFEAIEVTASNRTEARKALTGEIAFTVAGEADAVPSGGTPKPKLSKRPKAPTSLLSALSSLIDASMSIKAGGETSTTTTGSVEVTFTAKVPTDGLNITLNAAGSN